MWIGESDLGSLRNFCPSHEAYQLICKGTGNHAANDVPAIDLLISIMKKPVMIGFERSTTKSTYLH